MILLSYFKRIFILCLCALFLFFSCSLFDQDDDDDDVDNDIRILPDDIEQELESIADNAPPSQNFG